MLKTLEMYIFRSIAGPTMLVALVLLTVSGVLSLFGELESAENYDYGFGLAVQFVLLEMPISLYELAPTIMLLGALLGLGALASGSELVVMRASGVSLVKLGWAVALAGLFFSTLIFCLGEFLVPAAHRSSTDLEARVRYGESVAEPGSVWLREGRRFIHIEEIQSPQRLNGVQEFELDDQHRLVRQMQADTATYRDGQWRLQGMQVRRIGEASIDTVQSASRDWKVEIAPGLLRLSTTRPDSLTVRGLYDYARYLQDNELDAHEYWATLWQKLVMPATVVVMSLMAVPFSLGSLRSSGNGQRLFFGVILGVGFFLFNEILGNSGQVYGLPTWATAMMPTALLAVITLGWLRYQR